MKAQKLEGQILATSDVELIKKLMPEISANFQSWIDHTKQSVTDNSSDIIIKKAEKAEEAAEEQEEGQKFGHLLKKASKDKHSKHKVSTKDMKEPKENKSKKEKSGNELKKVVDEAKAKNTSKETKKDKKKSKPENLAQVGQDTSKSAANVTKVLETLKVANSTAT